MISKKTIRREIRALRQQLTESQRQIAGLNMLKQLRQIPCFLSSKKISVYLANDGELPLDNVVDFIWDRKRGCYLPVLFGKNTRIMHFAAFNQKTRFVSNRYGILEPNVKIRCQLTPGQLDLVLMPLVAFDRFGNRLGMGGGFYDRTFSFLRQRKCWRKPHLIGIAYDFQQVDKLPRESWDIPLDYVVTETRIIKVVR